MAGVPESVERLVERFERNRLDYRSGKYNETEARREFIDPLFAALGWDVDNHAGLPEAYKEVVHEDAIKVGSAHKAPDYGFRVGGVRKFFVEAKKPSVNLKDDPTPAFQLRRYAWSAKLPLSVLTDFEEFAIYDGGARPDRSDSAAVARRALITYDHYVERWEDIAGLFSRAAVLAGALDQIAAPKRGTATVDAVFLKEIESWRELLARDVARRNPGVSQRELNYAVQMTIDRVIFLRMAEDRGIEQYGRLLALRNGGEVYARLRDLYRQADERYNSGLFHFHREPGRDELPDDLTPRLDIGDAALREIVGGLYYPDSPYEFSVLPVDVLGQVYEQFLGKVIQIDDGRVAIEEKPEVRKAGGVYYTPKYIVDYIVAHTVGRLLEGKTPRQADRLKIVDPACGSGSFLLGAYGYLLDWRRDWYVADGPEKHPKELYQTAGGAWRLTTAERRKVLLANLYGVDIDPQAVEVTKLSLLLKQLEGESGETLVRQLQFAYRERVLPDLADNIKCGNSLIGPDFYDNQQMSLLPSEDHYRINVFDWQSGFPAVFTGANPGFDAVIGNPPYIRIQALKEWAPIEVEHYKRAYRAASKGNYDIYVVFVERGLQLLNKDGLLGFILPHKFFNAQYGEPLRALIAEGQHLREVVNFGHEQVFAGATTYTCLLFLSERANKQFTLEKVDDLTEWRLHNFATAIEVPSARVTASDWNFSVGRSASLLDRLGEFPVTMADLVLKIAQGIRTSANEVYVLDEVSRADGRVVAFSKALDREVELDEESVRPFLQGREIRAYQITPSGKLLILPYEVENGRARFIDASSYRERFPLTYQYLEENKSVLEARERGRMRTPEWYAYVYPKNVEVMATRKIIVPDIADRASFAFDAQGRFSFTSGYGIVLKDNSERSELYTLGLLNSSLLDLYLKSVSTTIRGGFFRYFTQFIEQLPIRTIDPANPADVARHDQMVALVERMLALQAQRAAARTSFDANVLGRQIEATDRQIDRLVYALYGLSDDEIAVVEGTGNRQ